MLIEIHDHKYKPNKQHFVVQWYDLEKDEDEPNETTIDLELLEQHIVDEGLNVMHDFPNAGDLTPLNLSTWLFENEDYALKHYLENRIEANP